MKKRKIKPGDVFIHKRDFTMRVIKEDGYDVVFDTFETDFLFNYSDGSPYCGVYQEFEFSKTHYYLGNAISGKWEKE